MPHPDNLRGAVAFAVIARSVYFASEVAAVGAFHVFSFRAVMFL